MPKAKDVYQEKPQGKTYDEVPTGATFDTKPKGVLQDKDFNENEDVTSVLTVGAYMGIPVLTYTVAGTATFTQPRGGRAG